MKYISIVFVLMLTHCIAKAQSQPVSNAQFRQDFNDFCETIERNYAYFNKKKTDWSRVKELYAPAIDTITTRSQFTAILEKTLYELYDHHSGLNTNTPYSRRLVPTNADLWAEYINGKAIITEARPGYGPAVAGVREGMEVMAVNDIPVNEAILPFLMKSSATADDAAKSYALRLLLAGDHVQARKFTLKSGSEIKQCYPDQQGFQLENIKYPAMLESHIIGKTGYIRINNCLYDNDLITVFDSVMKKMQYTESLILDMRETASGGNTTVARAILGWFTDKEYFYQKHEDYSEEKQSGIKRSWEEIVSPRKNKYYGNPLAILVNHWTGSIAEAIVIGFDGMKRKNTRIIGTTMARLDGAIYTFEMPNTKIRYSIPVERLYRNDGLPRENYGPQVYIDLLKEKGPRDPDIFISRALAFFKSGK